TAYLIMEDERRREVPVAQQSLPQLSEDREAQALANRAWDVFNNQKSGGEAVLSARYGVTLKAASAPESAVALGNEEAQRTLAFMVHPAPSASTAGMLAPSARIEQYTQQTRFAGGRNFFQNGNQWIDADVQKIKEPTRVRIQFNSPDYFTLAAQNAEA